MEKGYGCYWLGMVVIVTPEEVIKNHLEPLQDVLTTWIEGPYVAKMLNEPETRERYMGFVEGIRLSRANVIQAIINLTPQEEEE
jgi:hypothetical protein